MASEVGQGYVSIIPSARGFASRLQREIGSDLARAGKQGGQDYGKAFEKEAVSQADDASKGMSDKLKVGLAAGGALAGAALAAGVGEALDRGRLEDKLSAQLGGGPKTRRATKVAADLFNGAWGDSVEDVNTAVSSVVTNIGGMRKATAKDLKAVTASVLDIATAFDQDSKEISRTVDQMVRTDLAKGPREALDIITKGFQSGANEADDLLDTFNEYGTQFRKLGFDGEESLGLLTQGLKAGARDADVVADAFKEFSIRAVDGSDLTQQGFEALGLSAEDMAQKVGSGGQSAADATAKVLDKLRAVKDPAERAQIAVKLFGTQSEDLGDALFALDPKHAVDTLGKVGGAARRMGKTLNDNAATDLEAFKRQLQSRFVDFLGDKVIPAAQSLWRDVGPDVKRFGRSLGDAAEDIGPMVKTVLPIAADALGDVATAFGGFAKAFGSLPKPLQTAIITAALAGYGAKKIGGLTAGLMATGGVTTVGTTAATTAGTAATTAAASRTAGFRGLARSFWPYLLADAGYEVLVGDLWGMAPKSGRPRHTGAFGIGAATPDKPLTPHDTQTAAEMSGARFEALHGLGDLLKIGTRVGPEWLGIGNAFGDLDTHLANIADKNPGKAFKILQRTAADAGVPLKMLTDELPDTAKALDDSGIAARLHAQKIRGARDAGWDLLGLWKRNLLPTAKTLADRFDLNADETDKLRRELGDTTGTAKQHEKQLRQVARQLGLTREQTQDLIDKYGDVPKKVETRAEFLTSEAERRRDNFLRDTKGKFSDLGNDTYAIMVNGQSGHGRIFAEGGWTGPGSKMKAAGLVHADEFVTRKESRTKMERHFPGYLDYINEHGTLPGYDVGGRVNTKVQMDLSQLRQLVSETVKSLQSAGGSVPATLAWAKRQVGDPYLMGGTGPNAWDCSGFMSAITHHLMGQNPIGPRLFATSTFPTSMFARGSGVFSIGSTRDAGGGIGHMAGTLGGVNVESSGDVGVHMGAGARGAGDPLFGGNIWHLKQGLIKQVIAGGKGDVGAQGALSSVERWLISRESGGRTNANNPSSSAFGLGQLLSSNRVAYAKRLGLNWHRETGDTGTTNYDAQLAMMRMYIRDRYGTPRAAQSFWQHHGWYDQSTDRSPGILKPGYTVAYNGTGRDEYVTDRDPRRNARPRGPQRIVLDVGGGQTFTGYIRDIARDEIDDDFIHDTNMRRQG